MKKAPTIYPKDFTTRYGLNDFHRQHLPTIYDIVKCETDEYGIGIFAKRSFMRGECIGTFIAEETSELLQHSLQRSPNDNLYDPYFIGFLLHSCDPNVVLDMHQQKVYCIQDISEGAPLFMDYAATEDKLFVQFACCCKSSNCREWITGRNETVNELGRHYLARSYNVNLLEHTSLNQLMACENVASGH